MIVETMTVGPIMTNCYVIGDEHTRQGAVIDPGGDAQDILLAIEDLGLEVIYVINTHAHFDHTLGNAEVLAGTKAKLAIHRAEEPLLAQGGGASMFGISGAPGPAVDLYLDAGCTVRLGDTELEVLHTPGHTPGGISLYSAQDQILFSGDLLFHHGIGRTDLPGGDYDTIIKSLQLVLGLPEETLVYPGHGPETTIGDEKRDNPFI